MEGQLITGQWVEVLVDNPAGSAALSGFVLSLRQSEMLLTFPDLVEAPAGLESGHQVTIRHSSRLGRHTSHVRILRVAPGPPLSVATERLSQVETEQRRRSFRIQVKLPVMIQVVSSSIAAVGREELTT